MMRHWYVRRDVRVVRTWYAGVCCGSSARLLQVPHEHRCPPKRSWPLRRGEMAMSYAAMWALVALTVFRASGRAFTPTHVLLNCVWSPVVSFYRLGRRPSTGVARDSATWSPASSGKPSKWQRTEERKLCDAVKTCCARTKKLLWTLPQLSGTRLVCHCRSDQACHADSIIAVQKDMFTRSVQTR